MKYCQELIQIYIPGQVGGLFVYILTNYCGYHSYRIPSRQNIMKNGI